MTTHLVTLAFDLIGADPDDYDAADKELAKVGLSRRLTADNGNGVDLPFNTYAGQFSGDSAGGVRDAVRNKAKEALQRCKVTGKLFVSVGGNWAWGAVSV
jgi:hypothetical protein